MTRPCILLIAFLFFSESVEGQNTGGNPTLTSFNASRSNDAVNIDWTIRVGFSCSSVYIMHSTDSVNFVPIYEYPGICGASTEDITYAFTHNTPSPGNNYYKMDLGSFGVSGIIPVRMILYGIDGITVTTDENGNQTAYYYNPGSVSFTLEVLDVGGNVVFRQMGIEGDHVEIPRLELNGVFLVRMIGEDGTLYMTRCANY